MGGLRFFTRLIGYLKIIVLARLISPTEFGLFGITLLVLSFLEVVTEIGVNAFLIQEDKDFKKYINSTWTVSILRGFLIFLTIFILAHPIAFFFKTPNAYKLVLLTSLVPLLRGFINPSVVKFYKELKFHKEFYLRTIIYFFDAAVAIFFTLLIKKAEALILGILTSAFFELSLSWLIIKPRPAFEIDKLKIKKVLGRGKWIALAGFFDYFFNHGDDITIGRLMDSFSLGIYQMAYKISILPITEVADVFNKVSFPVFTKLKKDIDNLRKAYIKTTLTVFILVIPFGILLFFYPREIVLLFLGESWLSAVNVLKVLALFGVVKAIITPSFSLFLSVKKQKYFTTYSLLSTLGLGVSIIPLVKAYGIVGAGISACIGLFVSVPLVFYYSIKILKNRKIIF